jgi:hypothetical protein
MDNNNRFVLNIINYTSGFDLTGFRHELYIETEKEEFWNYSSKPIKIVWYSASDSDLRRMELAGKIESAYRSVGRQPTEIERKACFWHMAKQEQEAESAYPQGWYVAWQEWNQKAAEQMAAEIDRIRKEKGFKS